MVWISEFIFQFLVWMKSITVCKNYLCFCGRKIFFMCPFLHTHSLITCPAFYFYPSYLIACMHTYRRMDLLCTAYTFSHYRSNNDSEEQVTTVNNRCSQKPSFGRHWSTVVSEPSRLSSANMVDFIYGASHGWRTGETVHLSAFTCQSHTVTY